MRGAAVVRSRIFFLRVHFLQSRDGARRRTSVCTRLSRKAPTVKHRSCILTPSGVFGEVMGQILHCDRQLRNNPIISFFLRGVATTAPKKWEHAKTRNVPHFLSRASLWSISTRRSLASSLRLAACRRLQRACRNPPGPFVNVVFIIVAKKKKNSALYLNTETGPSIRATFCRRKQISQQRLQVPGKHVRMHAAVSIYEPPSRNTLSR